MPKLHLIEVGPGKTTTNVKISDDRPQTLNKAIKPFVVGKFVLSGTDQPLVFDVLVGFQKEGQVKIIK